MCPNVNTLIVEHEKRTEDITWGVETYPVTVGDVTVVLHVPGSLIVVPDE
jgi:hypothetical protein